MELPLSGLKVLDLSRVLSGPFCTMMLADHGAEVLKVENPQGGDDTRQFGPPFIRGESAYFLSINRNKKSMTLNLKHEKARELLWRLVERAEVVVENFRPGTMERWGFDWESLHTKNPRLIYASISGFGQTGPDTAKPGYDVIIQGMAGTQSLTGPPEGPPYKMGTSIADIVAGIYCFCGILLALQQRERTGEGQRVDLSMLDSMVSLLTYQAGRYFATGENPRAMGNQHPTIAPYEAFETKDGFINLAVANDSLWKIFCETLRHPEWIEKAEWVHNPDRVKNRQSLIEVLTPILRGRTAQQWTDLLSRAGIPCGPINTVDAVLREPQVLAREMVREVVHSVAGKIKVTGNPIKLSTMRGTERDWTPPPMLGEHTELALREWAGLSAEEVAALRAQGVV
ncbi:MAG: CaiB/BaiF CoA-transferase family protein [bacterium]